MTKTKGHPHAHLMKLYAEDAMSHPEPWKLWEVQYARGMWHQLERNPDWFITCDYRRKPRTIRIGNRDVPEPLRVAPEKGAGAFVVSLSSPESPFYINWEGCWQDKKPLFHGLLHRTREAAIEHAKALIEVSGGSV